MTDNLDKNTKEYLARIRRTIEESNRLVEQADLRLKETDRMLEQQGLTREQVMAIQFSDAQREMLSAEMKRRGMDPIEIWDDIDRHRARPVKDFEATAQVPSEAYTDDEVSYRQRKFGMMMKPFQI